MSQEIITDDGNQLLAQVSIYKIAGSDHRLFIRLDTVPGISLNRKVEWAAAITSGIITVFEETYKIYGATDETEEGQP